MEATTLVALVIAANRDDRGARTLDGPWATEPPRRPRARWVRSALARMLIALAARLVDQHHEAGAPPIPVATN